MADHDVSAGTQAAPAVDAPQPAVDAPEPVVDVPEQEDELQAARALAAQMEDRWRRTAAELDNFRKRTARESGQQRDAERALVTARWLPVVDNLELALEHASGEPDAIVDGVRAVRDQALAVLADLGYARFDDRGEMFDPQRHEAVSTVATAEATPGTVVHVIRPRYGDGARMLRPATVVVAAEGQ